MKLSLSAYSPFSLSQTVTRMGRAADGKELAEKVARVALAVLFIVPALLADFLLSIAQLIHRHWITPLPSLAPLRTPILSRPEKKIAPSIRPRLSPSQIEEILRKDFASKKNTLLAFKRGIQKGFALNLPSNRGILNELLRNQGVLDGEGDPPIDIFQWSATCYLLQRLLNQQLEHKSLNQKFNCIRSQEEKAKAIFNALTLEKFPYPLTPQAQTFFDELREEASESTQSSLFRTLYFKAYPIQLHITAAPGIL